MTADPVYFPAYFKKISADPGAIWPDRFGGVDHVGNHDRDAACRVSCPDSVFAVLEYKAVLCSAPDPFRRAQEDIRSRLSALHLRPADHCVEVIPDPRSPRTPSTHLVVYHMALHHSQFSSTTHHNHQDSVKLMFLCPKWRSEIYRFLAINVSSKFAKMFKS